MNRRLFVRNLYALCIISIGSTLTGCLGLGQSGGETKDVDGPLVEMTDDNQFRPESIVVPIGETVVWRTVGYAPHTVTAYEDEIPEDGAYFASGSFNDESAARNGASDGDGFLDRRE